MNKELEQCLTQFVSKALDIANKGIDIAGEQIPLILQEIVYWKVAKGSCCILTAFLFCTLGFFLGYSMLKNFKLSHDTEGQGTGIGLMFLSFFIFLLVFSFELTDIIKALVAPRLVILDYLKGLL